jgi:hypothetical protein
MCVYVYVYVYCRETALAEGALAGGNKSEECSQAGNLSYSC